MAQTEYREIEVVEVADDDSYYMRSGVRYRSVPDQWMLDVNSRYQVTIQLVVTLATALFGAAPLLFNAVLNDSSAGTTLWSCMNFWARSGFSTLAISVGASLAYFYFSAKWVSQAWGKKATAMWFPVSVKCVERCLDWSFWIALLALVMGGGLEFWFFFSFRGC